MEIATAAELIFEARQAGLLITLSTSGRIAADGPRPLIDQYRDRIKENKPALLAYFRQFQQPESDPRPVGDFTAAVATDAALGRPAGMEVRYQHDGVALRPTHRTTAPLLYHQPGHGPFIVPAGTVVHVFPSLFAARAADLPAEVWEGLGEWAFKKNVEKGYCVAWLAGDLRGIHPDHLEKLPD